MPSPRSGARCPADRLPAIVVAAADHGVAAEGVSSYPQAVTGQMLANFASGGAAVSVLAREAGAGLVVVDAGVVAPARAEGVRRAVENGSAAPATSPTAPRCRPVAGELIERGIALAEELAAGGVGIVAVGDMGIANTGRECRLRGAPARPIRRMCVVRERDWTGPASSGRWRSSVPPSVRTTSASPEGRPTRWARSPRSEGSRSRS